MLAPRQAWWLPAPPPPRQARTALRSGACGLEGLTGTESPAADGMYKTGPDWVGLDTAEEGCGSSLRGGSAETGRVSASPEPTLQLRLLQRRPCTPRTERGRSYLTSVSIRS